jgi:predicted O-methyltransferase YrrM
MTYPTWFKNVEADKIFQRALGHLAGKPVRILQIGAFTGDATEWLLANIATHPDSVVVDVDPWTGSDEPAHKEMDWMNVEDTYLARHQASIDEGKLVRHKMMSDEYFDQLSAEEQFDFIYVDGDHKASTVLRDAINSLKHLKPRGLIGFDDYNWTLGKGPAFDPKTAIEAFFICNQDILEVAEMGYQFWVRRKA